MLPRFFSASKPSSLTSSQLLKLLPSFCSGFQLLTARMLCTADKIIANSKSSAHDKKRAKKLKTELQNAGTQPQVKEIIINCLEEPYSTWFPMLPVINSLKPDSLNYGLYTSLLWKST